MSPSDVPETRLTEHYYTFIASPFPGFVKKVIHGFRPLCLVLMLLELCPLQMFPKQGLLSTTSTLPFSPRVVKKVVSWFSLYYVWY